MRVLEAPCTLSPGLWREFRGITPVGGTFEVLAPIEKDTIIGMVRRFVFAGPIPGPEYLEQTKPKGEIAQGLRHISESLSRVDAMLDRVSEERREMIDLLRRVEAGGLAIGSICHADIQRFLDRIDARDQPSQTTGE